MFTACWTWGVVVGCQGVRKLIRHGCTGICICRPSSNLCIRLIIWTLECFVPLARLAWPQSDFTKSVLTTHKYSLPHRYRKKWHLWCCVHTWNYMNHYSYLKYSARAFGEGSLYFGVWCCGRERDRGYNSKPKIIKMYNRVVCVVLLAKRRNK